MRGVEGEMRLSQENLAFLKNFLALSAKEQIYIRSQVEIMTAKKIKPVVLAFKRGATQVA